jgi:hypothetical protein
MASTNLCNRNDFRISRSNRLTVTRSLAEARNAAALDVARAVKAANAKRRAEAAKAAAAPVFRAKRKPGPKSTSATVAA